MRMIISNVTWSYYHIFISKEPGHNTRAFLWIQNLMRWCRSMSSLISAQQLYYFPGTHNKRCWNHPTKRPVQLPSRGKELLRDHRRRSQVWTRPIECKNDRGDVASFQSRNVGNGCHQGTPGSWSAKLFEDVNPLYHVQTSITSRRFRQRGLCLAPRLS